MARSPPADTGRVHPGAGSDLWAGPADCGRALGVRGGGAADAGRSAAAEVGRLLGDRLGGCEDLGVCGRNGTCAASAVASDIDSHEEGRCCSAAGTAALLISIRVSCEAAHLVSRASAGTRGFSSSPSAAARMALVRSASSLQRRGRHFQWTDGDGSNPTAFRALPPRPLAQIGWNMRSPRGAAFGVALLVAQVPALETGEAIPWCVAPDTYVKQPPLCDAGDGDTYSIEFVSNAPRTWCSHRNLLAAMNLPFGDLQFDCYGEKDEKGSACMPLPHEGQQAVCDYSGGHGEDEARCTDVSDGALLAGADSARATSLALTTSTGRIVLANLNTDESASFQAPSYVKTRPCRGPSCCLAEASRRLGQPAA